MATEPVKLISIVSPIYRAQGTVERLCEEIRLTLESMGINFEIVLVDDGSPDRSWDLIEELSKKDPRIRGIKLSRNFGQHYAITAGIDHARGDWIGVIDCDLEDHPRYFKDLIAKMHEGYNVVFARRIHKKHGPFRLIGSRLFVMTFNFLTGINHDSAVGTFSIIDRKVADAFKQYRESLRGYTLLVHYLGYKRGYVDIEHERRLDGKSTYSLRTLLSVFLSTTIVYTEKPLRAISLMGIAVSFAAFLFTAYVIVTYFLYGDRLAGWSSLIASIYLAAGAIVFSIGVIGLYLGKCFKESLKRPLYHVDHEV